MQFKLDNDEVISLEIVRKPNMKHIYLRVTPKGVVVSANRRAKLSEIEAFVVSKSAWIRKHLQVQAIQNKKRLIKSDNNLYFKGESFLLDCQDQEELRHITLEIVEKSFNIIMPPETEQNTLERVIDTFYKEEAIRTITPMVKLWSEKMQLFPSNIGFRRAKRQWGSCSSQNSLSFNFYLMKLPLPIIEYVVVHELSHIKEKNHSQKFWALVEKFLPNYRELTEELREFERVL